MPLSTPINNVYTTLTATYTAGSSTTLTVANGNLFVTSPVASAQNPIRLTVIQASTYGTTNETLTVFSCTDVTGNVLTVSPITTGPDASTDHNFASPDIVEVRITAGTIQDLNTAVTLAAPLASPTFTGTVTLGAGATEADIAVGNSTGTKIGTATTQKLGFYNVTPVVQPTGDVVAALTNLGLVASPQITHWTGGITTINCTSGKTAAIDCASTNAFVVNLYSTGGEHTFTLTNLAVGQTVKLTIIQGATAGTVAWGGTGNQAIRWTGGTAPTLSTTTGNADTLILYSPATDIIGGAVALANF